MRLATDADLAEQFGISLEEFHKLRRYNRWPCVKLGRREWRFTEAQVEQIITSQTVAAEKPMPKGGQTQRSASRGKRSA